MHCATISRQEKTSLFTIFAAALDVLLYRYSGSDDILLGVPLADRDHSGIASGFGFPASYPCAAHEAFGRNDVPRSAGSRSKGGA